MENLMSKVKVPKKFLWKAIRSQCLDCAAGSYKAVRSCPNENCPLYPYRFGHAAKNSNAAN